MPVADIINESDDHLSGNVLKFADDTNLLHVYGIVDNQHFGQRLQKNIDIHGNWTLQWQMNFNV